MTQPRFRGIALAALLAVAVLLPAHPARSAGDWLTALSGPLADAGYRLTWKSMTLEPAKGRVLAREVSSTDRAGRMVARIGTIALDRPQAKPDGGWSAERLLLENIELPGPAGLSIRSLTVARPDMRAIGRLLSAFGKPPSEAAAGGPPVDIDSIEIKGLARAWSRGGESLSAAVDALRVSRLRVDPQALMAGGNPQRLRPLSLLAAVQVGQLEAEGIRSRSSRTGSTDIARHWLRNAAQVPGRSGTLEYGTEGIRMHPDQAEDPADQFLATLFPPRGVVDAGWSGEVTYDVAAGFLGYRQRTDIGGFGRLDAVADLRDVPDMTAGEWETARGDDPRLARTSVDRFSMSLTDAGGVERVIAGIVEDPQATPPAELRANVAEQVAAIGEVFNPNRDPMITGWLNTLQDFVRRGGTLALAATRPIPVSALPDRGVDVTQLPALARRYELSLQRR